MLTKIIVGLTTVVAIVHGLAPDLVPENILPLVLVLLGLVYGAMVVDAEDATGFFVFTLAVGGAAATDVLDHVHVIGGYLDAILDAKAIPLWSAVVSIFAVRIWNRLSGASAADEGSAE